jgi:threonine aldolase
MQNFASHSREKTAAMRLVELEHGIELGEFLHRRYHVDGVRLADIASELSQDVSTISRWMDRLGIGRRVRTVVAA